MERFFSHIMNRWGTLSAIIELGRPWNGISVAFLGIIGTMIALQSMPPVSMLLLIGTIIFIIYMAASMLNDYFDVDIDRINMPYRPMQVGKISQGDALATALIFYTIGLFSSIFISFSFFITIALMSFLSVTYSVPPFRMEGRGFLGNVILGLNMIFTSMYAGYVLVVNTLLPNAQFLISVGSFTFAFILLNVIKDLKDIQGDRIHKKYTLALGFGKKAFVSIIFIGAVMLLVSSFIFNMFYFQNMAFILMPVLVFVLMAVTILNLYRKFSPRSGETAWAAIRLLSLVFILNIFVFSIFTFI